MLKIKSAGELWQSTNVKMGNFIYWKENWDNESEGMCVTIVKMWLKSKNTT